MDYVSGEVVFCCVYIINASGVRFTGKKSESNAK